MSSVDGFIALASLVSAFGGYRLGLLARASSWLGMGLGLALASRNLQWILDRLGQTNPIVQLIAAAFVLMFGAVVGQSLGLLTGGRLRLSLPVGVLRSWDRYLGAVAGISGVLVLVWLLLPIAAERQAWPASETENSFLASVVKDKLPEPPETFEALRSIVGIDGTVTRQAPTLTPPPELASLLTDDLRAVGARATVKLQSQTRCGASGGSAKILEGTGFALDKSELPKVARALSGTVIVTNAHVIAGSDSTNVILPNGDRHDAVVVGFDPGLDIAFVLVEEVTVPGLTIGPSVAGTKGVVFGHPGGGNLRPAPFEIHEQVTDKGRDIFGAERVARSVLYVSTDLARGDSGAALVTEAGQVAGIIFAVAPAVSGVAYALPGSELRHAILTTEFTRGLPRLEQCATTVG